MIEALADGDVFQPRVHAGAARRLDLGEDAEHRVIQAQLALLDQFESRDGGDGLGQARQSEQGFRIGRGTGGDVGPAVALGEEQFAVLRKGERGTRDAVPVHDVEHGRIERLQTGAGLALDGDLVEARRLRRFALGGASGGAARPPIPARPARAARRVSPFRRVVMEACPPKRIANDRR